MTKPSQEQIEAWLAELKTTHLGARQDVWLPHFAALAYDAGRKAGMEEAAKICERRAEATLGEDATQHTHAKRTEAHNCKYAIRAAMEPDK